MRVFDCHFHIEKGLANYDIAVNGKNVIFNSFESYHQHKTLLKEEDSLSLIFDYRNNLAEFKQLHDAGKIDGLKIHHRIQKIKIADQAELLHHLKELNPQVPIIIDAFYFGDDLECQPSLAAILAVAKQHPAIPVIVAHSGGIETLRYFYHLKVLDNIYFDLSLSLAYLRETSVYPDLKNLLRHGNTSRIMFGTDYPFISAAQQLEVFHEMATDLNKTEEEKDKMLYQNAVRLFKSRILNA